jgi:high affinity Mn2+ porin
LHAVNILRAASILAPTLKNSIHTIAAILLLTISLVANAQDKDLSDDRPGQPAKLPEAPMPGDQTVLTMFPHSETSRFFIAGQANIIFQADGPFHSPY